MDAPASPTGLKAARAPVLPAVAYPSTLLGAPIGGVVVLAAATLLLTLLAGVALGSPPVEVGLVGFPAGIAVLAAVHRRDRFFVRLWQYRYLEGEPFPSAFAVRHWAVRGPGDVLLAY